MSGAFLFKHPLCVCIHIHIYPLTYYVIRLAYRHAHISSDQGAQIFQKPKNHLKMSSSSSLNIILFSTMFPFVQCPPWLPQDGDKWFLQTAMPV